MVCRSVLAYANALTAVLTLLLSFTNPVAGKDKSPPGRDNCLMSLRTFAEFRSVQGAPLSDKLNNVLSVKLVYDLGANTLYFVNSKKYKYHITFCKEVLGDDGPLLLFNALNYGRAPGRNYVLASLNYYEQSKLYALEFSSEDQVSEKQLGYLFAALRKNASMRDSIKLLVSSDYLLALDKQGKLAFPKIYPAAIYGKQQFQLLNGGVCYGILKMAAAVNENFPTDNDLLIIEGSPVHVPVCAGIITNAFQAPLSHINVLCHNRNIPSAADVNIMSNKQVAANLNKPVKLEITNAGITITSCPKATVDSFVKSRQRRGLVPLKYDVGVQQVLVAKNFGVKQKDAIGNKAAGLGELQKLSNKWGSKFRVPEGAFAIPFYYFHRHIAAPNISAEIAAVARMYEAKESYGAINKQLKRIREAIKNNPLDAELLREVKTIIAKNGQWKAYRFRSSSNAEDAAGFSGAGLYESKTGKVDDKEKPIDMAIKKVWASAFTEEAYRERRSCSIDERTMMMGVLVHRSFPDEAANGVAITRNIYRKDFPGFVINVQVGEVPVVAPPDSVVCEQFVCMKGNFIDPLNFDVVTEYITTSNINKNKPVLTRKQVTQLYEALATVKSHFYLNRPGGMNVEEDDFGLDIEFKFDNNGQLYLKQVRPYR
jgi:pyruvate, water dikinase